MSKGALTIAKYLIPGLVLALVVGMSGQTAEGAVGDVVRAVDIPFDARCDLGKGSTSGSAVAVVQGSKVGVPESPILLAITCAGFEGELQLRFLDPGTPIEGTGSTAELKKAINVTFPAGAPIPDFGFRALTLRADTGDLLACGDAGSGTVLYAIDISIFNNTPLPGVPDGTATFLRAGPAGSTCAGVAWDVSDKTIFQPSSVAGPDGSLRIFHFPGTGAAVLPPIASGCGDGVAGLALAGPSLFVGCIPFDVGSSIGSPSSTFAANGRMRVAGADVGDVIVSSEFKDFVEAMDIVLAGGPPPPSSQIRQINKANGTIVRTITGPIDDLGDLECDATSFGGVFKDVIWVKDEFSSDEINAVEIPAGTCSLSGSVPLLASPGACPVKPATPLVTYPANPDGSPLDTDGDGLLDCWEDGAVWVAGSLYVASPPDPVGQGKPGIDFDGDGIRDVVLCVETNGQTGLQPAECANKSVKDVFVEFDAMAQHAPPVADVNAVVTAFALAPVENPGSGGPGPTGVNLHIQRDDLTIPHKDNTALPPCTPPMPQPPGAQDADFDTLKKAWFGTVAERPVANDSAAVLLRKEKTRSAKKLAFRYGLSVHNLTRIPANAASPSGCAEVPGNDFIVALGSFGSGIHRSGVGTQQYLPGTLMHELGHTLGLRHGGGDNSNCKPNYLSVMSYPRQFRTVITDRPLDYSRQHLPDLDEGALNEGLGIVGSGQLEQAPGAPDAKTVHGTGTAKKPPAAGPINWNADNSTGGNVALDINAIGSVTGCDGVGTVLAGYDDWANLVYNFRATLDFADGAYSSSDENREVTDPQVQALSQSTDADGDGVADTNACGGAPCAIDIVPGVSSNKVLLFTKQGVVTAIVPVALLSSAGFDATDVDPGTVVFASTPPLKVLNHPVCVPLDVNRDRRRDLVCTFVLTGLSPGEQTAILEGTTFGDVGVRAEGTMVVVKP